MRGLTYLQLQRLVEPPHEIRMHLLHPQDAWVFNETLDRHGTTLDLSPAIRARVARAENDPISAVYEFVIWQRLSIHAYVRIPPKSA